MQTITIPRSALPARGHVVADLLTGGHKPGVLSFANLTGRAAKYPGAYLKARRDALLIAVAHGVIDDLVLINGCKTRVWVVAGTGQPVALVVDEAR